MGQEVDCLTLRHRLGRAHRRPRLVLAMLCAACTLHFASEARAQCSAKDVLHNRMSLKEAVSADANRHLIKSATDVPAWKRITLGTFKDSFALRNALDAAGCRVGELAEQILARPAFVVTSKKAEVELVAVSAVELGFATNTVSLAPVYARARQLGFEVAAAELGPQLRLQYFDQPMGEFLIIGMKPIKTWSGEPVILSVVNGGAGLILIGQDGGPDAEVSANSRFVFVRPNQIVLTDELRRELALVPP
jgi:hypothetical protein